MNPNLDQYTLHGQNVGTEIKNKLASMNFGTNGSIGEPQTIVLTQNDLGDSRFLPINIPDLSGEAYEYLRNKAGTNIASGDVNYDVYNKLWDDHGIEAANWYENNPSLPHLNPHLNPLMPIPLDLVKNQPVSDTDIPDFAGAQDGDEIAFLPFGGGNDKTPESI